MGKNKKYKIRIRIWIDETNGSFLGTGRVLLLEKIKETGSITNAAKEMKMSYRQAWQLVEDMNKQAKTELVRKILGGKKGSRSELTDEGERVIKEFRRLEKEIEKYIKLKSKKLNF
ncbi:MAG TPA: LysR family transcriptional regulator [Bacteroidia bacterium]|nr:LysR family transcriptional regulator [Bacteroidia bacterium]